MEILSQMFAQLYGNAPQRTEMLDKAGSNRVYSRLYGADGASVVGVQGSSVAENRCFAYLSAHFAEKGLPVPRVLAMAEDGTRYLQDDLGRLSLYDALRPAREAGAAYGEKETALLRRTLRALAHIQVEGGAGLDKARLLSPSVFDAEAAMFDLNYFKYCFLKTTDLYFDETRLEADFRSLAETLGGAGEGGTHFLYRDFQARNVMLREDKATGQLLPWFIDFQGGRIGPLQYDLASFLWQASARYPDTVRNELTDEYLDELSRLLPSVDKAAFKQRLSVFVLFRTLQVLGAYGLRGYFERKRHFLDSIPPAIENLRALLASGVCGPWSALEDTLRRMCALPRFVPKDSATPAVSTTATKPAAATAAAQAGEPTPSRYDGKGPLVVRVYSFSYKKGIPADTSGNGGGYVFDCRSTHNPGRYDRYKPLTGLDEPVIGFLEEDGEILVFLESVYKLADAHVRRYMQRGFTDLMFCFGCTGGRHRSVYSAQHLAERLNRRFGIEVRLCHREQGIEQVFPARKPEE